MAKLVSALPVTEIKIHSLYVVKDTILANLYKKGQVQLLPQQEYAERVVLILSRIRPDIAVQRIVGRHSENPFVESPDIQLLRTERLPGNSNGRRIFLLVTGCSISDPGGFVDKGP